MTILQVNNIDLVGRRFNGYDLNQALSHYGQNTRMLVTKKISEDDTVFSLFPPREAWIHQFLVEEARRAGVNGLWSPAVQKMLSHPAVADADLVHYHLIHAMPLPVTELPQLTAVHPSLWTVHDIWAVTGGCTHPLSCEGWRSGCKGCEQTDPGIMFGSPKRTAQQYEIKRHIYRTLDLDLVAASSFTTRYLKESPLFSQARVHRIPFGIHPDPFTVPDQVIVRGELGIPPNVPALGFRYEDNDKHIVKGGPQLLEMLELLPGGGRLCVITCGGGRLPEWVGRKFHLIELGWRDEPDAMPHFFSACDLFLMPSLVESFGLMAIEAMAAGRPVIVFENTVLPEITFAPNCGIAVPYLDCKALAATVLRLIASPEECAIRGERGIRLVREHYRFEDYVRRHLQLYEEILRRNRNA